MSVTDVKYAVIIWLQHLQKINICPTIDENKVLKLHKKKVVVGQKHTNTDNVAKINITACFTTLSDHSYLFFVFKESSAEVLPSCYWYKCVLDLVTVKQCLKVKRRE